MAITRATGFPTNNQTSSTAPAASWVTVGDLGILSIAAFIGTAQTIASVSSTKATGVGGSGNWTLVGVATDTTDGFNTSIYCGLINSTGADTITVTWTGGTPGAGAFETVVDEWHSGLGATNVWAVVTSGSLRDTTDTKFPSLTSNTVPLQGYFGYQCFTGSGTATGTAGYTFTLTGISNIICFNGALATSTAAQPAATGGPTTFSGAGIISVALPGGGGGSPLEVFPTSPAFRIRAGPRFLPFPGVTLGDRTLTSTTPVALVAESDSTSTASATLVESLTAVAASTSSASAVLTDSVLLTGTCRATSTASAVLVEASTAESDSRSTARATLTETSTAESDSTSAAYANVSVALAGTCASTSTASGVEAGVPPVAGYAMWYDASQITGQADNSVLATWPDLSGNGRNVLQATGAKQPTYYSTTAAKLLNRLPAVWFDGANGWMQSATFGPIAQPTTVFVVAQSTHPSGSVLVFDGSSANRQSIGIFSGNWYVNASSTLSDGPPDLNPHVFAAVFNSTSSTFTVDANTFSTGGAQTFSLGAVTLGGTFADTGLWTGPICEVIVYPSALTATQVASVISYLTFKWISYAVAAGSSNVSANLVELVTSESDSSSAAYATLSLVAGPAIAGTVTATSTANASLTDLVTAEADGRSAANATLVERSTAVCASGSAAYATLTVSPSATVASTSAAYASASLALAGTAASTSAGYATMSGVGTPVIGTVAAMSAAYATITVSVALAGTAAGTSTANASLVDSLSATTASVSKANATLISGMVATSAGVSTAHASVRTLLGSAEVDAHSVAFATASVAAALIARCDATTSAYATLLVSSPAALVGTVTATSAAYGFLPLPPIEFTAGHPAPYWTTGDSRPWWAPGEPRSSRWEPGEPLVGWTASQALLEATDADNATPAWQTGEPRS